MPASVITRFPTGRRNELLERISKNATRLRGQRLMGTGGTPLPPVGRADALEQLMIRQGVIPIICYPSATSLTGNIQALPSDRNLPTAAETITVSGGTAPQVFTAPNPAMVAVAFTAAGNDQVVTAIDSVDASATGRAKISIPA